MSERRCATCDHCSPASDARAAQSYVQCLAPIETPPLPTNGDQREIARQALAEARREPRNWTTIGHVEGRVAGLAPAGSTCPLWREKGLRP